MVAIIKKIVITAHKNYQAQILETLQRMGVLQVEDWEEAPEETPLVPQWEQKVAQVKFAINLLEKYQEKPKDLKKKMLGSRIKTTLPRIKKIIEKFDFQKVVKECRNLEAQLNQAQNKIEKYKEERNVLLLWQNLNLAPRKEIETQSTKTILGTISSSVFPNLLAKSQKETSLDIKRINSQAGTEYLTITYLKKVEDQIQKLLGEFEFKPEEFPEIEGTPREVLKKITIQIQGESEKIKNIEAKIKKTTRWLPHLKILSDYLTWQKEQAQVRERSLKTDFTFSILGWIDEDKISKLQQELAKISSQVEITEVPIRGDETIPVIIKNRSFIQPFEVVTNIYGVPLSKEPDPTPWLAPFFVIFFGLCLSDAGYGLILAGLALAFIKILKMPRKEQGLFRLLIYGGITTFFWGVIFGGWLGIDLTQMPESLSWLSNTLVYIRRIDPVKNPIQILILSLILGTVQILAGISINLYWKIKNKKGLMEILDDGLWIYFILVILFWGGVKMNILPKNFEWLALYLVGIGVISLVLTQGRRQKNILLKIGSGVMSLYGLMGYLSDVLSYSRLLALVLATGIIAMVVNLVAGLFKDMIPYLGWLIAIFILVGGHLFNLAISALGAFIHSGRLQFVEFFSKFMEGGGMRFRPFTRESKYVSLQ